MAAGDERKARLDSPYLSGELFAEEEEAEWQVGELHPRPNRIPGFADQDQSVREAEQQH